MLPLRNKLVALTILALVLALALRFYGEIWFIKDIEVYVSGNVRNKSLELNIVNDSPFTYHDVILRVNLVSKDGGDVIFSSNYTLGSLGFYSRKRVYLVLPEINSSTLILNYALTFNIGMFSEVLRGNVTLNIGLGKVETKLIIYSLPPRNVRWAEIVYFRGRLVAKNSGKPVANAEVLLICHDEVLGDTVVARSRTGSDGFFEIKWLAHRTSLTKSYAELYLKFPGNIYYKGSRWPNRGYYRITVFEHRTA